MKNLISFLFFIIILWLPSHTIWSQTDTNVFLYDEYIALVKNNHPIAYQAQLQKQMGAAYVQKAKGGFDPKLKAAANQKYFDGKQYYSYLNAGLKIPTWFGIEVQGGYDSNTGERLNPEAYTPESGQWYAGIKVNLGEGLFIDARRAELKAAKIYQQSTEMEQRLMMNQLIYDASIAYWDWYKACNKVLIYENAKDNATVRFEGVKQSCFLGEKPFIDTLKAIIQVQNQQLKLEQAKLEQFNKKAKLDIFLWQDGNIPLEIGTNLTAPDYLSNEISTPIGDLLIPMDSLILNHPEMLQYKFKIELSKIDYRLSKEALKPELSVNYNALAENENFAPNYSINNYKWGAQFSYAIFTRKERANVALSALKLNEQESKYVDKYALVNFKILSAREAWISTEKQIELTRNALNNYEALFLAEMTLFNIGESSIFLVNTRDQDRIKSQLQLVEIITQNAFANTFFNYQVVNY